MSVDTLNADLATLRQALSGGGATARYYKHEIHWGQFADDVTAERDALDRVEAELSRLRKLWEQETERAIKAEGINWDKAQENARLREQRDEAVKAADGMARAPYGEFQKAWDGWEAAEAELATATTTAELAIRQLEAAEARCARLQQALDSCLAWKKALAGPGSEQSSLTESGSAGLPDTPADSQEGKT